MAAQVDREALEVLGEQRERLFIPPPRSVCPGMSSSAGFDESPTVTWFISISPRSTRDHPGRFGFFATLPLPDVDDALAEIDRASKSLTSRAIARASASSPRWTPGVDTDSTAAAMS